MRQVFIQVPYQHHDETIDVVRRYDPINLSQVAAHTPDENKHLIIANISNGKVSALVRGLSQIPSAQVTLVPIGVFAFRFETAQIPDQVTDIELLSPIEVFLNALQSIGSVKGFVGYAAAGGMLIWLGLFLNSVVLLIAGMLISPFASPAMNAAIALTRGDMKLLRHSLLRYTLAIGVGVAVSVALSVGFGLTIVTQQMESNSEISDMAMLIPLVVGVGAALSLIQSQSSSLISGTVAGLLAAASLGPPVALLGIGAVVNEWGIVRSAAFIIVLQLLGINLGGMVILRLANLQPGRAHYDRGKPWLFYAGLTITVVALSAMFVLQRLDPVDLQRASVTQEAAVVIQTVVQDYEAANLIELQTRFTRTDIEGQHTLLVVLYVQPVADTDRTDQQIAAELRQQIRDELATQEYDITTLIDVSVLSPAE